jgi:tol-pal system protein YbgF
MNRHPRSEARVAGIGSTFRALQAFALGALLLLGAGTPVHAQLFSDDEARKAILQTREKLREVENASRASAEQQAEQVQALRRTVLELVTHIEQLRGEVARLRGTQEQLTRDVAELQRAQKDVAQGVDERLRRIEPVKVSIDGVEFTAEPDEKRRYEEAVGLLRGGDFAKAAAALQEFSRRHPDSGYSTWVSFWLGNALYGQRAYKEAITAFRVVTTKTDHPKAPEALLAMANCQLEAKDAKAARASLAQLVKAYPQSEAAKAARERLASLPAR